MQFCEAAKVIGSLMFAGLECCILPLGIVSDFHGTDFSYAMSIECSFPLLFSFISLSRWFVVLFDEWFFTSFVRCIPCLSSLLAIL